MKFVNKYLLLFILFLCIPFLIVDADPMDPIPKSTKTANAYKKAFSQNREISGIANDINYDITSFKINEKGSKITFNGWSYVDHMDNVGGIGGNLRTWIVAYVGDWKNSWHNALESSTTPSVSSAGKYYAKLADSDNENLNFFYSRATIGSGTASTQLERVNKKINSNTMSNIGKHNVGRNGVYTIDWCLELAVQLKTNNWNGMSLDSRCVYYNVGFTTEINFDDIVNNIGVSVTNSQEVKFRIVSSVLYQQNETCKKDYSCDASKWKTYYKTDSANLGVYKKSCKKIFGNDCSEYASSIDGIDYQASKEFTEEQSDGSIYTVTRSFIVKGLSDKLEVTINNAHPCKDNECRERYSNGVFQSLSYGGRKYLIDGVTSENKTINGNGGTFRSKVYRLMLGSSNDLYSPSDGNIYKDGGYWKSGNKNKAYIPASWAKISGEFSMKITKGSIPTNTSDPCAIKCIGGNCKRDLEIDDSECKKIEYIAPFDTCTVGSSPTGCNASSYSVKTGDLVDQNKNCLYVLNDTYYYRMSVDDINSVFLSDGETLPSNNIYTVKSNNGFYYFPIKFYSKVEVEQTSSITPNFPIGNGGIVDSGRYFIYSSNVNLNAKWQHINFGDYQKVVYAEVAKNGVTTRVPVNVKLKNGESIYNANYMEVGKIGDGSLYTNLTKSKISTLKKDISISSNTVEFSDSNDANNAVKTKPGVFTCNINDNWSNGEISATCNYTINKAYQKIDNTEDSYSLSYGDYLYVSQSPGDNFKITDNAHIGSIYYIPLNLKSNFVFDVKFNDLSFINKFNHTYTGTCNVGYKNKLGQVRYRPIDVKNPFPNSSQIPSNWSEYIKNENNLKRITERSFNNISYQTVKVSKLSADIFDNYGIYASMIDMSKNGTSSVLSINELFEIGSIKAIPGKNYCASGVFSPNCDLEIGS